MQYISTRGGIEPVCFQDAVMMGLADDGGLLIPESIPHAGLRMEDWGELSYIELAYEIMRRFIGDISEQDLQELIAQSYQGAFPEEVAPLR
ncbi:MAG: threonine synthase, partial [Planctomycetes bacterium]|nr:threonine synthase [Planctomycetota bacterium]